MAEIDERELRRLRAAADREEIRQVLLHYCRGIDRSDAELVRSVFHEDATLDYGRMKGGPSMLAPGKATTPSTHFTGNVLIELDGDVARTETYFIAYQVQEKDGSPVTRTRVGRYVDRFERRGGEWKIADRILIDDWSRLDDVTAVVEGIGQNAGLRTPEDPSYARLRQPERKAAAR